MKVTTRLLFLLVALVIFTDDAMAIVLVEEDFSGSPGDDLTTKGWTAGLNSYELSSTTIEGDYVQSAAGALLLEIAGTVPGTEYDSLIVDGQASLDGALGVALLGGYQPATALICWKSPRWLVSFIKLICPI